MQVMQNMKRQRLKRTVIDKMMNKQILGVFAIIFIFCLILAIYTSSWARSHKDEAWYLRLTDSDTTIGIVGFFAYVLLLHSMVPLAAYVSVELTKVVQGEL